MTGTSNNAAPCCTIARNRDAEVPSSSGLVNRLSPDEGVVAVPLVGSMRPTRLRRPLSTTRSASGTVRRVPGPLYRPVPRTGTFMCGVTRHSRGKSGEMKRNIVAACAVLSAAALGTSFVPANASPGTAQETYPEVSIGWTNTTGSKDAPADSKAVRSFLAGESPTITTQEALKMGIPESVLKGEAQQETVEAGDPEVEAGSDHQPGDTNSDSDGAARADSDLSAALARVHSSCTSFDKTVTSWKANLRGVRLRLGCNKGNPVFGWRKAYYKHGRTKNAIKNGTLYTWYIETDQPNYFVYHSEVWEIKCRWPLGCRKNTSMDVITTVKFTNSSYLPDKYSLGVGTSYCDNNGIHMCPKWARNPGPY